VRARRGRAAVGAAGAKAHERRGAAPTGHEGVLQLALVPRRGMKAFSSSLLCPDGAGLKWLFTILPTGGKARTGCSRCTASSRSPDGGCELLLHDVLVPRRGMRSSSATSLCPDGAWGGRSRPPCCRGPVQGRGQLLSSCARGRGEAPTTLPPPSHETPLERLLRWLVR